MACELGVCCCWRRVDHYLKPATDASISSNFLLGIVLRCAASAGALSSAGSMVSMSLFGSAQGTERERLKETTSKLRVWLHGVVSSGGFKVRMAV